VLMTFSSGWATECCIPASHRVNHFCLNARLKDWASGPIT
jgi:hypothetical protein